ncbi:hypothetical protein ACH4GK_17840 [Streptomyces rimosus]|uniref:hypothetical protein n=1 Tax=Streptomyces rimosus TaxID=1927 RepID=UPI00067CE478|nr:hypothetical protein [Streptomyces rimosus]
MQQLVIVDIYAAAAHSGVKPGTLRQRLRRGALTHHGYDRHGRALVDLTELTTAPNNEQHTDAA